MTIFVSRKAQVDGHFEGDAIILGETVIGSGTLIGKEVIVGYPVEKTLRSFAFSRPFNIKKYDALSKGAKIGEDCIIRSGTVIYETATLGNKVRTGHNVLVREGSVVGEETLIGSSVKLDGAVKIGRRVQIQSNAYLPHLTIIEDDVFIAPNVCFTNDPYPQSKRLAGVVAERNSIICANATLIAGVKIGKNAVVGAGAVVTKDVPPDSVVLGNPARFHMTRKEFDEKREA
ncbi:MAG: N-acetyltransferase [Candidatus Bathyarchaeota archaeon]|nr:N-acetyltransferase [Candidatus Bathyarchaeota archaeon]